MFERNIKLQLIFILLAMTVALTGCAGDGAEKLSQVIYEAINEDADSSSGDDSAVDATKADSQYKNSDSEIKVTGSNLDIDLINKIETEDNVATSGIQVYDFAGDPIEREVEIVDEEKAYTDNEEIIAADLVASLSPEDNDHSADYAYSMLNDECRKAYVEIFAIIKEIREKVVLSTRDEQVVDLAFRSVMVDHPELFYLKGYSVGKYMYGEKIQKIFFSGTYTFTRSDIDRKKQEVEAYVTNVMYSAPLSDDYAKIKYVYDYLVRNNEYVDGAPNNQNILSVVENGKTVCQGYAKMTQLLLNRMGVFCTLVNGEAIGAGNTDERESHVWNIVRCNGRYYNLDPTWGDSAFKLVDSDTGESIPAVEINYEFFLVDDASMVSTHFPNPVVQMPECNSLDDNYYVREGFYFTGLNSEQLAAAFDKAYTFGDSMLFLKCADYDVYNELTNYLIDEQRVFDYVVGDNIRYVTYPERNLIFIAL